MPAPVERCTAALFHVLARVRAAPAFHPQGAAYPARIEVGDEVPAFPLPPGVHEGVARLSRGVGLPHRLPDILGLAVRVPDAHGPGRPQDLLLSSVLSEGRLRFVLCPSSAWHRRLVSSVAPYRSRDGDRLVGARPTGHLRYDLTTLERAVRAEQACWDLLVAPPRGPWSRVGGVVLHGERLPVQEEHALGFDPWHTADDFVPAGWINRLRRPAYAASRRGRRRRGAPKGNPAGGDGPAPT